MSKKKKKLKIIQNKFAQLKNMLYICRRIQKKDMEEVWKDIDEYYQVSTLGRVKSTKKGKEKILKGYINNYGYVTLTLNGKT